MPGYQMRTNLYVAALQPIHRRITPDMIKVSEIERMIRSGEAVRLATLSNNQNCVWIERNNSLYTFDGVYHYWKREEVK